MPENEPVGDCPKLDSFRIIDSDIFIPAVEGLVNFGPSPGVFNKVY